LEKSQKKKPAKAPDAENQSVTLRALPKKDLLRPDEVAAYFSLSVRTVYAWIDQGKLEAFRVGGSLRIAAEAVEKLLALKSE
jgi:excisionase family DNA binding protein